MTAIYILSDGQSNQRFKLGSHTGTLEKLKSRYITAIPSLIVHYFIETPDAYQVEKRFKQIHIKERVTMELHEIIGSLLAIFLQCKRNKKNETTLIIKPKSRTKKAEKLSITDISTEEEESTEVEESTEDDEYTEEGESTDDDEYTEVEESAEESTEDED